MKTRVETITPAMARRWLDASAEAPQRSIRRIRVDKLIAAIEAGDWILTHQGIAIGADGRILDGQHRLTAIAESGIEVECLVSRDVSPEIFDVVDTGIVRSPGDALRIAGYADVNVLAASIRTIMLWGEFGGTVGEGFERRDRKITSKEIVDWLGADPIRPDLMRASVLTARRVALATARYGATTAVTTGDALFRLAEAAGTTDVGPATRAEFNERLIDGVMLGPGSPILALRRWFVHDSGYVNQPRMVRRQVTIGHYVKAQNDYALGLNRDLSLFRWRKDVLPVPVAKGTRDRRLAAQEAELAAEESAEQSAEQTTRPGG